MLAVTLLSPSLASASAVAGPHASLRENSDQTPRSVAGEPHAQTVGSSSLAATTEDQERTGRNQKPPAKPVLLDLGEVRYRAPVTPKEIWLGLDTGGVFIPEGTIPQVTRDVWTVRTDAAWSIALTPWLSAGGRHGITWYDAENIRAQYSNQLVHVALRPTAWRPIPGVEHDRLELGFEAHDMFRTVIDEGPDGKSVFHFGGFFDRIFSLGYGMSHRLRPRLSLDWNVQGRYVWVFVNRQRQVRTGLRLRWRVRDRHVIAAEAVGYVVFRDPLQAGNLLPRASPVGFFSAQYDWMSRRNVGLFVRAWGSTSFLSGLAPVYEVREEAVNQVYGELGAGLRVRLP